MGDFTIQISSNLVNRLIDDGDKPKKTKRTRTKATREPQQPQAGINQTQVSGVNETHKGAAASGWPPYFMPVTPPLQSANVELDAIRSVLKESESVMEKLQKQEETMVQEVTQRAKDLREKEFKLPNQKPMPCLVESEACLDCYKDHVKDPLKCAHFVKNFADCARRVRQQVSSAE